MVDPVAAWRDEHEYFARLLRLLQKQVDVFHAGREPNYAFDLPLPTPMAKCGFDCDTRLQVLIG